MSTTDLISDRRKQLERIAAASNPGAFYRMRKIEDRVLAGNAGNAFYANFSKGNRELAIPACSTARA